MSLPAVTSQPQSPAMQAATAIAQVFGSAGIGALAGYAFGIINPVGGAVFGATSSLTSTLGNALAEQFGANQTAVKTTLYALSFIASFAVGIAVTTAVGFPITVMGAVGLTLAMAVTTCFIQCVLIGGLCCGAAGLTAWAAQNSQTTTV